MVAVVTPDIVEREPWLAYRHAAPAPLHVCFLIDQLSKAGTETQLLSLLRHLDRRRVQPHLVLLRDGGPESHALEPDDCPVLRLNVRSLRHPSTWLEVARFARWLRRERIDVLQVYFPDSTHFGVAAGKLAGVRRLVRTRFNLGYWMKPHDRWLGRLHSRLTDATVVNCSACQQALVADEWASPEAIHVIENGVDLDRFTALPMPAWTAPVRPVRIGMTANLRPVKEPGLLIEAARRVVAEHPQVEFHLAGEGELRPALEQAIQDFNLQERVFLHGRVDDIPAFLAEADLAVLCSRSEGSSNAILEYMAAGRAVVATAVGGTQQLIEHGVHGLLVTPGDAGQLAAALSRLLRNPSEAQALAQAARRRVCARHDVRVRARRYEQFFLQLMRQS